MFSTLNRPHMPKMALARLAGVRNAVTSKLRVISVMGGPGSGKGTQCTRLTALLDDPSRIHHVKARLPSKVYHINVGNLLREESNSNPDAIMTDGRHLAAWLADGSIVPSDFSVSVIKKELTRIEAEVSATANVNAGVSRAPISSPYAPAVLLDGFPRSVENLDAFEAAVGPLAGMVLLDVSPRVMLSRVSKRALSGHRRSDDTAVAARIETYVQSLAAITERFTTVPVTAVVEQGTGPLFSGRTLRAAPLCIKVNAEGDMDEVQAYTRAAVASINNQFY